jgi:carotenoid cleavage dioxygenase-like enzyme
MAAFTLLLAVLAQVSAETEGGFNTLWRSTWRNITTPRELSVTGSIPSWLQGSLFRNAGGAFESPTRNVTFAFDGIPKIFKFTVADGKVLYQERFLSTLYYEYIQDHHDLPKAPLMGATVPPFSKFAAPAADKGDVDNIQVWHLNGDDRALALTDASAVETFDMETLETLGHLPLNDSVKEGLIQLSCAHPQYDPNSDQRELLNFASTFFSIPGSVVGHHEISVYRMGVDKVRRPFGSVTVSYAPYIHSFGVTKTKMILVVYPLGFDVTCVLEFNPMMQCMRCPRDRHATVYIFDLASTEKSTKPIAVIEAPYHMVMHHVNAYDVESGDVVFEVSAQDDCDTLFSGPTGQHANLAVMQDETARDKVQHWGKLRTYKVSLNTSSQPTITYANTNLRDADGYVYEIDFPFVNPKVASQQHRYVWGLSSYARNSSHYEDWAVLKVDRAATGANTKTWYKKGHYPMEPVFVPKPDGVQEDEGVVLVQVQDGEQNRGYLLILDAATLTEIATASLNPGEHLPYSQHGRWYDLAKTEAMMV